MKTDKEYPEPMIMSGSLRRIGRHKMFAQNIPVLAEFLSRSKSPKITALCATVCENCLPLFGISEKYRE